MSRGRVQVLPAPRDPVAQARVVMAELQRLSTLSPDWDWARCAVIAREWEVSGSRARLLRDLRYSGADGQRGDPGLLVAA